MIVQLKNYIFYKFIYPLGIWFVELFPEKIAKRIVKWLLAQNNKIVLKKLNNKSGKILLLLPKCLQNLSCDKNIIFSIDNCVKCGSCKIKDIANIKQRYGLELKIAPGGELAKSLVEEIKPDCTIAVACEKELLLGIKNVSHYNIIAIPNIINNRPCINTDVEIQTIEFFIHRILEIK